MILNQKAIPYETRRTHHKDYEDQQHHHISYDDVYELRPIQLDVLIQQGFPRKPMCIQAI
jgi:hypothetical protein